MADPAGTPDGTDADREKAAADRVPSGKAEKSAAERAPSTGPEKTGAGRAPAAPEKSSSGRAPVVAAPEKTGAGRVPTGQNRIVSGNPEKSSAGTGAIKTPAASPEKTGTTRAEKTGATRPVTVDPGKSAGSVTALKLDKIEPGGPAPSSVAQRSGSGSISMLVTGGEPNVPVAASTSGERTIPNAAPNHEPSSEAAPAEEDDEKPSKIGRYGVIRRLGTGGMADVFLCRQSGMGGFDRQVVVKRVRGILRDREDVIFMFLDEARIIAQVNHPNIVQIYDIDEQDGLPYLVMEYVRGLSLEGLSKRLNQRGAKYPIDLVAAIGVQACAGLHAAHELRDPNGAPLGVIHRDVSPSNILLSVDGVAKIIDFGVARAKNRLSSTSAGHLKGRAGYIAPEALTDTTLDRRADIFALGVVLYELCSGKTLFERESDLARLSAVLTTKIPLLTEVRPDADPGMAEVLSRALELDPRKRPESAAAFGTALHAVAMRTGRYITPTLVAEWLEQHLPADLKLAGRHLTPRPAQLAGGATESTQPQPSPFSTTVAAPAPAPSSVSPVSSMVTSLQLPHWSAGLSTVLGDISQQVRPLAPLVPMMTELQQEMRGITPAVGELAQQVRLMRRLYWPLVTLFWLFGLGLILLGVWMMLQASKH